MIVWINGAFGAGKTTLAAAMAAQLETAMVVDPELIGTAIREIVPPAPSGDFQDIPLWRDMVASLMLHLRRRYREDLIVPMTLVNPEYVIELFGALRSAGEPYLHVFLHVDPGVLRQRIVTQIMDPLDRVHDAEIRSWRLAQLDRCVRFAQQMPERSVVLDSGALSPAELAERVLTQMRQPSLSSMPMSG